MFVERQPYHRADQLHSRAPHGALVERVTEDHVMAGLFGNVATLGIGFNEQHRGTAGLERTG